jgi:replication-associated recombination protein RarA
MNKARDPWVSVKTFHDLPADEVISSLQKEIRRGNMENAVALGYEMYLTSPEMEEKLWKRLLVISVEDIGHGNPQLPELIYTLYKIHQEFETGAVDRPLFALHAIRLLAESEKDRSTDEMKNLIHAQMELEGLIPNIPDYAIDMHTNRGQKEGKDEAHFYQVASKVFPESENKNHEFREKLIKLLGIKEK